MYDVAVVAWGMAPSEFWCMCPAEFWRIYQARKPAEERNKLPDDYFEDLAQELS